MVPGQHQSSACFVTHTLQVESFSSEDARTLDDHLRSFWNLEAFGIDVVGDPVLDDFYHKIHFTEGRYEVSLPWKDSVLTLPDNYQLCRRRLYSLLQRLRQEPDTMKEYDAIIRNQIELGIASSLALLMRILVASTIFPITL